MPAAHLAAYGSEDRVLHVFDLPQLYTKPSASDLLEALDILASKPPTWENTKSASLANEGADRITVAPEGVTKYLTAIVASSLRWIDDDEDKESIWEQASLRLSERSGRSAMPAMSRIFCIPTSQGERQISIHEPAMTADNLGFKTWGASYLLAKRLEKLELAGSLSPGSPFVLELGAGTGLVGIAAAHVLDAPVVLTDLPEILPNLIRNADANNFGLASSAGRTYTAVLDWTQPDVMSFTETDVVSPTSFSLILAADSIYSDKHPGMLAATIRRWLSPEPKARIAIELPVRSGYSAERDDFRQRLEDIGLEVLDEGHETGYDDWGCAGEDGDLQEVRCWWSIWGWKSL